MIRPLAGDIIPPLDVAIAREDLIRYAGAADDYVRLHWDHPYMIANGFPDVAVHGWLTFAHMCRAVTQWLPPEEWAITAFSVRYVRPTYPGSLRCGGEVVLDERENMTIALWAKDSEDQVTTTATMSVRALRPGQPG